MLHNLIIIYGDLDCKMCSQNKSMQDLDIHRLGSETGEKMQTGC